MGTQYRMPTHDEIRELISGTTQTFIDVDGNEFSKEQAQNGTIEEGKLKGVRFTGSNRNSIFIPAASSCQESLLLGVGGSSYIWSSSLSDGYDEGAWFLYFDCGGNVDEYGIDRYCGHSVRGVRA
jgi:hypothetical protein